MRMDVDPILELARHDVETDATGISGTGVSPNSKGRTWLIYDL